MLEMRLDGSRRRDHTEQHSGQHLLSATLLRLFDAPTRSFHLGPERSTIDIACSGLDEGDRATVESAVNDAIADDYRIITHVCPPEDLGSFRLRRVPPAGESVYRVVEIDGLDYTPCCGTHAGSTAELRLLLVLGTEKYKGLLRVHFVVGGRAVRLARESTLAARQAAGILGCEPRDLGIESARQSERLKAALAGKKALLRAWAGEIAGAILVPGRIRPWQDDFLRGAEPGVVGPFVAFVLPDKDAEAALEVSKALSERGKAALVASGKDRTVTAMSPGQAGGPEAGLGQLLGPWCVQFGGNGGGGKGFFRATFPSTAEMGDFLGFLAKKLQN
jgi:alanyl-tRNA synthetase